MLKAHLKIIAIVINILFIVNDSHASYIYFKEQLINHKFFFMLTIIILPIIIISLLIIIRIIFLKQKKLLAKLNDLNIIFDNLPEVPMCGYLYCNPLQDIFFFSPSLKKIIGIQNNPNLTSFKEILTEDSYHKIANLFHDTNIGIQSKKIVFDTQINNISLECRNRRIFDCTPQLINSGYFVKGVIFWFYEASNFLNQVNSLNKDITNYQNENKSLKFILDSIKHPAWIIDNKLSLIYSNKAFKELTSKTEILVDNEFNNLTNKVINTNKEYLNCELNINQDFSPKYFDVEIIKYDNKFFGTTSDITLAKSIKKELKQYILSQKDYLESTSNAIAIYNSNMRINSWNEAFVNFWQLSDTWLNTQPTYEEILEILRQNRKLPEQSNYNFFKKQQIELFHSMKQIHNEILYLPDGQILRLVVVPQAAGGLLFSYENITDRLELERSYNTLIEVLNKTFDNIHEGIAVFAENGKLQLCNSLFKNIWKLESNFIDKKPHFSDFFKKMSPIYALEEVQKQSLNIFIDAMDKRLLGEIKFNLIDETRIHRIVVPLPNSSILISDLDVTDSATIEQSLREINDTLKAVSKFKTNFLSNVSYDLRVPLTTIVGITEILRSGYAGKLNEKQLEYSDDIYRSSNSLMNLIDDIIDVSTIEAFSEIDLEIVEFNLNTLLNELVENTIQKIKLCKLDIKIKIDNSLGNIRADKIKIEQLILKLFNYLISNHDKAYSFSIQNIKNNIVITIEVNDKINGKDFLIIKDFTGVFENYYGSTNNDKKNKIISLSIINKIISLHNGKFELKEKEQNNLYKCIIPKHLS